MKGNNTERKRGRRRERKNHSPGQRRPPPHQRPWLPIRWGREQLLGYWARCETVKGSAARPIPRGREGEASMGPMPFSFTLPSSPPALVMTLLLNTEEQLDWLHRCMSTNTALNTLHVLLAVDRFQSQRWLKPQGCVVIARVCFWWQHALLWVMIKTPLYAKLPEDIQWI